MNELELIWAMYYAQITGMSLHPGNKKETNTKLAAQLADAMLLEHQRRWGEPKCPS